MIAVYYDGHPLHCQGSRDAQLLSLTMSKEVNKCGTCDFVLAPSHPMYSSIAHRGIVTVADGAQVLYKGFVTEMSKDWDGLLSVSTNGLLAWLGDSVVRPYSTYEKIDNVSEWPPEVDLYFKRLIEQHNAQCPSKAFMIGTNEGASLDPNNYVPRTDLLYPSTAEVIEDKILDRLGGYLDVTYDSIDSKPTISLLSKPRVIGQDIPCISFGVNMLDFVKKSDCFDVMTAIVPLGKTPDRSGEDDTDHPPLTIGSLPDGRLGDSFVKQGDMIYCPLADSVYGRVVGTRTWDDVTDPTNLRSKGLAALSDSISADLTINVSAIDLGMIYKGTPRIECGRLVRVTSRPHDFDQLMLVTKVEYDLFDPTQTSYTIGHTYKTLTQQI